MVDFIHKANAKAIASGIKERFIYLPRRFEWVFVWQFDFDSPHATLVRGLFWPVKLDDELLQRVPREI
jgi:hypothetical protein